MLSSNCFLVVAKYYAGGKKWKVRVYVIIGFVGVYFVFRECNFSFPACMRVVS